MRTELIDYEATHDEVEPHDLGSWLHRPTRAEQWAGLVVQTLGLMVALSVGASLIAAAWVMAR